MTAEVERGQEVLSAGEPREAAFSSSLEARGHLVWRLPLEELLTPRRKGFGPSMSFYFYEV